MTKRPARQPPASRPARSSPPTDAHDQAAYQYPDGPAADDREVDLLAYIAKLVDDAPPLTSEQRDGLALILRSQHRS